MEADEIIKVIESLETVKNAWIIQNEIEYKQSKRIYDKQFVVLSTKIITTKQLLDDF